MAPAKRTVDSGEQIISSDGEITSSSSTSSPLYRWMRGPDIIDVFGFYLNPKQFVILLIAVLLIMGKNGLLAFTMALALYTAWNWIAAQHGGTGSITGTTTNGSNRNKQRPRFNGTGSNVRGVKDLPQPPKGG